MHRRVRYHLSTSSVIVTSCYTLVPCSIAVNSLERAICRMFSLSFAHIWYLLRLACNGDLRDRVYASSDIHEALSLSPVIDFTIMQKV